MHTKTYWHIQTWFITQARLRRPYTRSVVEDNWNEQVCKESNSKALENLLWLAQDQAVALEEQFIKLSEAVPSEHHQTTFRWARAIGPGQGGPEFDRQAPSEPSTFYETAPKIVVYEETQYLSSWVAARDWIVDKLRDFHNWPKTFDINQFQLQNLAVRRL